MRADMRVTLSASSRPIAFAVATSIACACGAAAAQTRAPPEAPSGWVAKRPVETSPLNRKGGEGQTAMCRLFYGLGWTKGQAKQTYGEVPCDAVSIEKGKKELMRLAKKYDAVQ